MLSLSLSRRSVTITSTRVPGTTKPATPMTSLTLTETARMPSVIDGGNPAPASSGASFDSVSGSLATTPEKILNRGLISGVVANEPLSIRVNEVVGVAGFVVPGTHVDVLVTLSEG